MSVKTKIRKVVAKSKTGCNYLQWRQMFDVNVEEYEDEKRWMIKKGSVDPVAA